MKLSELLIGKTLLMGVIISAALVLYGGLNYLYHNGEDLLETTHISVQAEHFTLNALGEGIYNDDPFAYILLGVILLFLTQLIRVAITVLIFWFNKEIILFAVSGFVFIALFGSVLVNM